MNRTRSSVIAVTSQKLRANPAAPSPKPSPPRGRGRGEGGKPQVIEKILNAKAGTGRQAVSSKTPGFTLLDLLLVVIILGIVGMVIAPHVGNMLNDSKLNSAALELVSALDYAKNLAITYQRPFSVQVFTSASKNQFAVIDHTSSLDNNTHPEADPPLYTFHRVYNMFDKTPYVIDFDTPTDGAVERPEYQGVEIISVPGGGSDHTIIFYPDGHSSSSDSSYALRLGSQTKTITVQGTTGRIVSQ